MRREAMIEHQGMSLLLLAQCYVRAYTFHSVRDDKLHVFNHDNQMARAENIHRFHQIIFQDGTFNIPMRYAPIGDEIFSSGAEGIIILAHDRETHQDVVIKKRRDAFSHPYLAKRTHREFVLTQMVNHKNVIRLLNAFTPQKTFKEFSEIYFVSEFVTFPLSHLIKQREQLFFQPNGAEIMSYLMYQLLCGIRHLHKAGIIHRDLSVSNIVVDKKSQLKIIDLGSARPEEKFQNLTGYVCMRYYRAPEIVLGIDRERLESCMLYDRKVDLWSAGCILAEMITGKPLFAGINNLDQWNKIVQVVGSPKESFAQNLPEEIKNFVERSQKYEPKSWSDIFPDSVFPQEKTRQEYLLPMCNPNAARDLLSKLLVIDPVNRFSYEQALEHPYVRWQQEPGELENETNPIQHYNGYIEQLELNENEWKALIFAELKQYELMKAQENGPLEQRQECEKCIQHRCDCSECTKMDLSRLLN